MKKLILPVLISFLFVTISNAQIKIALLGGANASNIRSANIGSNQSIFGSTAGIAVFVPVGKKMYIKPELQISKRGYKIVQKNSGGNANFSEEFKQEISYLELPVEIVYPIKAGNGEFLIAAGPSFGFALKGKQTSTTVLVTNRDERVTDIAFGNGATQYKRLDIGGRVNVMYVFKNGFLLKADYSHSFSNLSNNGEYYNRSFGFSIGYRFGVGKKK